MRVAKMLATQFCKNLMRIIFLVIVICESGDCKRWAYTVRNGNDEVECREVLQESDIPKNDTPAWAHFDDQIQTTGWSFLEIQTSKDFPDEAQAHALGFLEGSVTRSYIWSAWQNFHTGLCKDKEASCEKVQDYLNINHDWRKRKLDKMADHDSYWYQVKLFLIQIRALTDGYNHMTEKKEERLTYRDIFLMNTAGDLEDLMVAYGAKRTLGSGHCSALIKLLADGSDIYVGHDTWSSYSSMLRIQKKYSLNYQTLPNKKDRIPGHTMSFSSYPGMIHSMDDFYILSTRLVTLETTIGNMNGLLWSHITPNGQNLEFIRVMMANRLETSGKGWINTFIRYNSGTYNNQWMIVDYNKFKPTNGTKPKLGTGLLWIVEQLPGSVGTGDMTYTLRDQGYWPSYNVPYFDFIYNSSGWPDKVKQYGDWFTYDKTPRALIFKRDHGTVTDMDSMMDLMRYNDFKHDPLSRCNCSPPYSAENAIAARNDLNLENGTYPFASLGHRSHGAIDTKITSFSLSSRLQFLSVSGPPHGHGLPPFQWSTAGFGEDVPHNGHPDLWQFKPIKYKWMTE